MTFPIHYISPRAPLSIAKTDVTSSTSNLISYPFNGRAIGLPDPDRYVAVAISLRDDSNNGRVTGVTIAGIPASEVVGIEHGGSSLHIHSSIWIAAVSAGTTADIVVNCFTTSTDCAITVYRITGIGSATASDTDTAVAAGGVALPAMALDIPVGGGVAIGCANDDDSSTAATWSGLTENDDFDVDNIRHTAASELLTAAQTARPIQVSFGTSNLRSAVCAVWAPG